MVWWQSSITEVLNQWDRMGVFSYVLPFLLIFAVVYAILTKSKLFGEENKAAVAIISLSIGLLALQLDFVSTFFQVIFPRFGIGIAVAIVLLIALALWAGEGADLRHSWIGYLVGIGVVVWAITAWGGWNGDFAVANFLDENFWALIVLTLIIVGIYFMVRDKKTGK